MARNVFISFLGSSNYGACYYVRENYKSDNVRYMQQATLSYLNAESWISSDKAFILVTEGDDGSFVKNWKDNGQTKYGTDEIIEQSGLESSLKDMKLPFIVDPITIKDGNSEQEIWSIFETVFNLLQEYDKLYIDITHGFRYLPMLSIVLANYGKFLKNITVESITYGNYEGRNKENDEAQIIDITAFSELQDWTSAANEFVNNGSTLMLGRLVKNEKLDEQLRLFSAIHNTVRAKELFSGQIASELSDTIEALDLIFPPFEPIKRKIRSVLNNYKVDDTINNGLAAIKYCIDFNLIQQGITIMTEFITTYVLLKIQEDWEDQNNRDTTSGCLSINDKEIFDMNILGQKLQKHVDDGRINENERDDILNNQNEIVRKVFELPFKQKLSKKILQRISIGSRHDINHAGIRPKPKNAFGFKESLEKYYLLLEKLVRN